MSNPKVKKEKRIKAWGVMDIGTGGLVHYAGDDDVCFYKTKKAAEKWYLPNSEYKTVPVEIIIKSK